MRCSFHSLVISVSTVLGIVALVQAALGPPCNEDEEHACCPDAEVESDGSLSWNNCYACMLTVSTRKPNEILLIRTQGRGIIADAWKIWQSGVLAANPSGSILSPVELTIRRKIHTDDDFWFR